MDIEKWMNIWGRIAYERAIEYVAERLYNDGATASDIRKYNIENRYFFERVADYMDYIRDMEDAYAD